VKTFDFFGNLKMSLMRKKHIGLNIVSYLDNMLCYVVALDRTGNNCLRRNLFLSPNILSRLRGRDELDATWNCGQKHLNKNFFGRQRCRWNGGRALKVVLREVECGGAELNDVAQVSVE
jgi:hypothetical protein